LLPLFLLFFFLELIQEIANLLWNGGVDERVVMRFERLADRVQNLLIQPSAVQIRLIDWFWFFH
jgi:hypothetical protein